MDYDNALITAQRIRTILTPHCTRIDIAGSIRRKLAHANDIDIVCQPKMVELRDMYEYVVDTARSIEFMDAANSIGSRLKGDLYRGKCVTYLNYVNGEGIKIELWMPDPAEYYRHLAIRTGSADYSKHVIANAWKVKGWVGSDEGLRLITDCMKRKDGWRCMNTGGEKPPVWESEQDFFNWLNIPYIAPEYREWVPQYLAR